MKSKEIVYDSPTRLFHWTFVGLFAFAFVVAKTVDDESPTFVFHMLAGMTLGVAVVFRLIWGVVGSRHARFSNWPLSPAALIEYMSGLTRKNSRIWAGHNPASSWAAIVMMISALGLAGSGLMMSQDKEFYEEVHEFFFIVLIVTAGAHILGVIFHTLKHRDPIGLAMVTGAKQNVGTSEAISSSHTWVAMLLLIGLVGFGTNLYRNFDPNTGILNFFGWSLQLGESEDGEKGNKSGESGGTQNETGGDENEDDD